MKFDISSSTKNKICMELDFDKIELRMDFFFFFEKKNEKSQFNLVHHGRI